MAADPTELYRLYNADDRLLYVGIARTIQYRLQTHSCRPPTGKAWWPDVAYCTLERFQERYLAEAAERTAIKTERPIYNRRSAVGPIRVSLGWPLNDRVCA